MFELEDLAAQFEAEYPADEFDKVKKPQPLTLVNQKKTPVHNVKQTPVVTASNNKNSTLDKRGRFRRPQLIYCR